MISLRILTTVLVLGMGVIHAPAFAAAEENTTLPQSELAITGYWAMTKICFTENNSEVCTALKNPNQILNITAEGRINSPNGDGVDCKIDAKVIACEGEQWDYTMTGTDTATLPSAEYKLTLTRIPQEQYALRAAFITEKIAATREQVKTLVGKNLVLVKQIDVEPNGQSSETLVTDLAEKFEYKDDRTGETVTTYTPKSLVLSADQGVRINNTFDSTYEVRMSDVGDYDQTEIDMNLTYINGQLALDWSDAMGRLEIVGDEVRFITTGVAYGGFNETTYDSRIYVYKIAP